MSERGGARAWRWVVGGVVVGGLLLAHHAVAVAPLTATGPLIPLARLADLMLWLGALLLAQATGARVLRAARLPLSAVEGVAFGTALGLGLGAYGALALGLVGLYRAPVLLAGVLTATVVLWRELAANVAGLARAWTVWRREASPLARGVPALVVLLAVGVALALLGALTPPHHYDPLAYHLLAPRRYLVTGRIEPLPGIDYANLPLTAELLYGVGLAFGSEVFGQLLHFAFGGLTAVALWALGQRCGGRVTAWLAVAVFLGTPLVLVWARVADIDLALACYLLLAAMAVLHAARTGEVGMPGAGWRWLALGGLCAGLALGSKYQALFAVPALGLVLLFDGLVARRRGWRGALGDLALFLGSATIVGSPWYLKNWLLLGNPIWPLFGGGRDFGPLAVELTNYYARGMTISPRTPLGYLALPLRAYTRGDIEQPLVILSPLFLLLPLLLALPRRRELLYLLTMSVALWAGWALGFQELRYLLPLCAPLSLAAAMVLRTAWARPRLQRVVLPALGGAALLAVALTGLHVGADRPLAVIAGRESTDAYLRRSVATGPSYRGTAWLATRARPDETVLFFNEAQLYYVARQPTLPFVARPDQLDLNLLALTEPHPDPADALAALRAEGVDYLFVNEANIRYRRRYDPEDRLARGVAAFDRLRPLLEPVYRDGPDDRPSIVIYWVPAVRTARKER